jgi:mannose-6-phosphate isomerase-like protein (cupin superfamily)
MPTNRGHLSDSTDAPSVGEHVVALASGKGWRVEQILSGRLEEPIHDLLDHDEWVMVVDGWAVVEIDGQDGEFRSGDWMHLPPGVPHRVLETEPGTSWLALHVWDDGD